MNRFKIHIISFFVTLILSSYVAFGLTLDARSFGAKADGKTLNTVYIQKAIDQAASEKGGIVVLDKGVFLSGTIFLKSNVTLRIEAGATLLGSTNISDYKELTWGHNVDRQPYHLIVADGAENISIEGKGTIDGNGEAFWQEYEKDAQGNMIVPRWIHAKPKKVSPLIEITRSRNINVSDVTIHTGGGWNLHLFDCDVAKVRGVNIVNNIYSPNSDGIDITGCNDVIISDCYIKTCDDAICLKTTEDSRECHRVTVTNCIIETLCVGLKMGCVESNKDMTDVTFSNCIINKSSRAIGIYAKDGAVYDRITISNITANTNAPLILNRPLQIMVNRWKDTSKLGGIRNVLISNFICETEGRIMLTCTEGGFLENVTLRDIILRYPMIEDPKPMSSTTTSGQFPKFADHPEAVGAQAAVVAENITNLVIDNLQVEWPTTNTIPDAWKYPERIENGSGRIHHLDYSKAKQTEFSAFWGNKLKGGLIHIPLATSSSAEKLKTDIRNSDIQIVGQ